MGRYEEGWIVSEAMRKGSEKEDITGKREKRKKKVKVTTFN